MRGLAFKLAWRGGFATLLPNGEWQEWWYSQNQALLQSLMALGIGIVIGLNIASPYSPEYYRICDKLRQDEIQRLEVLKRQIEEGKELYEKDKKGQ